jgi:hypothetical protein
MGLLQDLTTHRAVFYFFEREEIAYEGSWELQAAVARWFRPGDPFAALPDVLPVWQGSYLPHEAAFDRWGTTDVWAVSVGCASAPARRALVAQVRDVGALGLFDLDPGPNIPDLPLVLTGFLVPDAYIRLAASGYSRSLHRETGLDLLAAPSEEEGMNFDVPAELGFEDDWFERSLLRLLSRTHSRRLDPVGPDDGYDRLLDQAYDLFHLQAYGAAGAVAGVAYEALMQAALVGPDRTWLQQRQAAGDHTALNDIIAKVASKRRLDDTRLRRYQALRNDFAHRLGDASVGTTGEETVRERVEEMLRWCTAQKIDDAGEAQLVDVAEEPALSSAELFSEARTLADDAAAATRTRPMQIMNDVVEPQGFAWVIVRDAQSTFSQWLLSAGHASRTEAGVRISAPGRAFEHNLAWAAALGKRLRRAGISVTYGGHPD